jgi:hypothetical protein
MAFHVTDQYAPQTIDNSCFFCKAAQRTLFQGRRESVIDCEKLVDFEGWVSICESCVTEMAGLLGMITPIKSNNLKQAVKDAHEETEALAARLVTAEQALKALSAWNEQAVS